MNTVYVDDEDGFRQPRAIAERGGNQLEGTGTRDLARTGTGGADPIGFEFEVGCSEPENPPRVTVRSRSSYGDDEVDPGVEG